MKKTIRFIFSALFFLLFSAAQAQISSAQTELTQLPPPRQVEPPQQSIQSTCGAPSVNTTLTLCDSGTVVLTATNGAHYVWFDSPTGGNVVGSNPSYTTPVLYNTTAYYASAICDTAMMPDATQASTFTTVVRGYWFTAPCNFTIIGLRVPLDNTGAQSIEVDRLNATPPTYPSTTNSFTSLGYWQTVNTTSIISTNISVSAGDIIGIYGWRGTTDSRMAAATYTTSIAGNSVTLQTSGMQYDLNTQQMHDIWTSTTTQIGRVEMYYAVSDTSARVPDSVIVHQSAHVTTSGYICQGDSVFVGGGYQTASGSYYDTLTTMLGCDSVITTNLYIDPLPTVSATAFSNPDFCTQDAPVALPAGSPSGGTWAGAGVNGNNFDPSLADTGSYYLVYSFADTLGCSSSDSIPVNVSACTGIHSNTAGNGISVFPNPAGNQVSILLHDLSGTSTVQLLDITGRLLREQQTNDSRYTMNLSGFEKGEYVVRVINGNAVYVTRITRL